MVKLSKSDRVEYHYFDVDQDQSSIEEKLKITIIFTPKKHLNKGPC